jgi:hypothetical protein
MFRKGKFLMFTSISLSCQVPLEKGEKEKKRDNFSRAVVFDKNCRLTLMRESRKKNDYRGMRIMMIKEKQGGPEWNIK